MFLESGGPLEKRGKIAGPRLAPRSRKTPASGRPYYKAVGGGGRGCQRKPMSGCSDRRPLLPSRSSLAAESRAARPHLQPKRSRLFSWHRKCIIRNSTRHPCHPFSSSSFKAADSGRRCVPLRYLHFSALHESWAKRRWRAWKPRSLFLLAHCLDELRRCMQIRKLTPGFSLHFHARPDQRCLSIFSTDCR
jgi:hypothetical protein